MFFFRRTILATALTCAAVSAQSLDVDVVRDPNAGLAIYTATVQAPPGSQAFLFASTSLFPAPLQIPGVLNPLFLDPQSLFMVGGMQVTPFGQGNLTLPLPLQLTENFEIPFQAVVLDPAGQLALTNLATAVQGIAPPVFNQVQWQGGFNAALATYRLQVSGALPGDVIEIKVNGVVAARGVADATGSVDLRFNANLKPFDRITIGLNGRAVYSWLWC